MKILVIDGQGGQLGSQLIKAISGIFPQTDITAVGTNTVATAAMIKAGAHRGATGENPIVVACRSADVIIGPVGIVVADSLLGEVTPKMAVAVGQSSAVRILIPVNKCDNLIAGVQTLSVSSLIEDAVSKLKVIIERRA